MEDFYLKVYKNHIDEICAGCRFCDFNTGCMNCADEIYIGYDGGFMCRRHINEISPLWRKCPEMEPAGKKDYIRELFCHLLEGLSQFPKGTVGKTKEKVVANILNLYRITLRMYPPAEEIKYDAEFFDPLTQRYREIGEAMFDTVVGELMEVFMKRYYPDDIQNEQH